MLHIFSLRIKPTGSVASLFGSVIVNVGLPPCSRKDVLGEGSWLEDAACAPWPRILVSTCSCWHKVGLLKDVLKVEASTIQQDDEEWFLHGRTSITWKGNLCFLMHRWDTEQDRHRRFACEKGFLPEQSDGSCLQPPGVWMPFVHGLWTHRVIASYVSIHWVDSKLLCGMHFLICKQDPEWHGPPLLKLKLEGDVFWRVKLIFATKDYRYSQDALFFQPSDTDNKRYIHVFYRWKSL